MKKILTLIIAVLLVVSMFAACAPPVEEEPAAEEPATEEPAEEPATEEPTEEPVAEEPVELVKVGMITDSGTIDDESFNQGTWEGILKYEADFGTIETKYLQPSGIQHADYASAMYDLIDADFEIIVCPGYMFETSVNEVAAANPDIYFILLDGMTHNGDYAFNKLDNVVNVYYFEQDSGFIAGVAGALSSKTGKLGFIGGMEVPAVVKFGLGYKAGVIYSNAKFDTDVEVVDYVYQGSFDDVAAGKTLAGGMYDKGIDVIFAAAGGVGVGAFNEAKERAIGGDEVYMIGVDGNQHGLGVYDEGTGASITLTSALKLVGVTAYDYIGKILDGTFPGGEILTLGLAEGMLGLPEENPNLTDEIIANTEIAKQDLLDGVVVAPTTEEEMDAFEVE